ncbi:MAG TPA: MFS transporter, partial [Solirubrobacteraceae bacterium]|nr:MFS transporter [Solirubrobacteraceae bacterium]
MSGQNEHRYAESIATGLENLPYSGYHVRIILALAVTGFIEAYATAATGPLAALAHKPLHLTASSLGYLVIAPTLGLVLSMTLGGTVLCDRFSRRSILLFGVVWSTLFTGLSPLAGSATQLIVLRFVSGIGYGLALPAAYPIGVELMPARRRHSFAWIYEIALGLGLISTALVGYFSGRAHLANAWRIVPLPAVPLLLIAPVLLLLFVPQSPRWLAAKGRFAA